MADKESILIVDDDESARRTLALIFGKKGYETETAGTGREALEKARGRFFNAALLDIRLSDVEGVELLAPLKEMHPDMALMMVTGYASTKTAVQALNAGASAYITKPVDMDEMLAKLRDILERQRLVAEKRQAEGALQESQRSLQAVVETAPSLIVLTDPDGRITLFNRACEELTGYKREEVLGKTISELFSPPEWVPVVQKRFANPHAPEVCAPHENPWLTKTGEQRLIEWRCMVLTQPEDGRPCILGTGIDITERKRLEAALKAERVSLAQRVEERTTELTREIAERMRAEERLRHAATHDALTGLPNRASFLERLEAATQHSRQDHGNAFAVLFLDLDRFKIVNDNLGHAFGDRLLVAVARRLETCLRAGDAIARFGGDEFALLLTGLRDVSDARRIADYVQEELNQPVHLNEREIFTTASIGIVFDDGRYDLPADFLRDADVALYRAKVMGRARYEVFDTDLHEQVKARWQLEADLRRALKHGEFQVYYQPFVSLADGQITGIESLLRWHHPRRGLVVPDEFINLAEETGLIEPIGAWALHTACVQVKAWQAAGFPHLRVAVNVSTPQLLAQPTPGQRGKTLVEQIKLALQETNLSPQTLELEILESVSVGQEGLRALDELSRLGVRVSLDDFGLGSALDCLKRLPLNALKIDRSFVSDIPGDADDEAIVQAMIAMGHGLELNVIAEGVETQAQLDFLRQQGCDEIQGQWFAPPMPAEALTKLLQEIKTHGWKSN